MATQLDVGKSMPEPWQPKALKAIEESVAKIAQEKKSTYVSDPLWAKKAMEESTGKGAEAEELESWKDPAKVAEYHEKGKAQAYEYQKHFAEEQKIQKKGIEKSGFKASDIEDYFKHQEKHQAGPQWEPTSINPYELAAHPDYGTPFSFAQPKSFEDMVDQHAKFVDWKDYKPLLADPAPEAVKKYRDRIIKAGGNPDVALLKGSHKPKMGYIEGYPAETPDKSNSPTSSTKALFFGDEKATSSQYGPITAPYVAVPRQKVAVIDYKDLMSHHYGSPVDDKLANAYVPEFMKTVKHIREKYDPEMLVMHNVYDWATGGSRLGTQYLVFKPNILRASHAQFDPTKWHLKLPLAGILGMAAGAGIYSYGDQAQAAEHKARGGKTMTRKDKDPEDHEFINFAKGGLIDSGIPGRTDKIPMKVSPGSYVLPADIPSALGQGNTKAGSEILKKMFTHSAYGLDPMKHGSQPFKYPRSLPYKAGGGRVAPAKVLPADHQLGMKVPKGGSMCANCRFLTSPTTCSNKGFVEWNGSGKLPNPADEYCCDLYAHKAPAHKAEGGKTEDGRELVPIIAAGGEMVLHPDIVKMIGHGDISKGHSVLDKFVIHARKENIKTLRKLKPPKR